MTNDVCDNELQSFAALVVEDAVNAVWNNDPLDYMREIKALALYCPEIVWLQLDQAVELILTNYDKTDQKFCALLIALAKECDIFVPSGDSPAEAILRHWRRPIGEAGLATNQRAHHKAIILKVLFK
jgi:hypothetical protein